MSASKQRRVLAIVATDATFVRAVQGGAVVWVGKCIFCGRALTIGGDGVPRSAATIEHIWPRTHGGDDGLANLALACGGCNREKGMRHDTKSRMDARLAEIVAALRAKRQERWREPPPELAVHAAWAQRSAAPDDAEADPPVSRRRRR
ncbi:MAG: HNH endonuclease [Deltaproteobacteria bacterium]|nr:HNH endonuclease [Deltaproteobacteria bacterium]